MRGAHPERAVERAIEQTGLFRHGECVLVACSGGPDSVALMAAARAVAKRAHFTLRAAHINHGLRESAWQDECVALQITAQFETPIDVVALESGSADEQRLRTARYDVLIDLAKRHGCTAVATAHHAEDQSETVLLALLRGTGPAGLRGMRARRRLAPGVDLLRPFLGLASDALRHYCHARVLPYAVDPSNSETNLRRNAVREALAALRPLFPGLDAAVARAADVVGEERDSSRRAQLRRSVREQLGRDGALREIDFLHVEEAVRALESGRTGSFHMKPGVVLRIESGVVRGITRE
jgi:tRNA(Ile)-lysidine synthase